MVGLAAGVAIARKKACILCRDGVDVGVRRRHYHAVFSLVDTVLLKPLPYPDADALVTVYELIRRRVTGEASSRRGASRIGSAPIVRSSRSPRPTLKASRHGGQEPERLAGVRVEPRFSRFMGSRRLLADGSPTTKSGIPARCGRDQ